MGYLAVLVVSQWSITVLVAKKTIFAKYFNVYFNTSSSVARMKKGEGERVFKERKPKTFNIRKTNRDIYGMKER